MSQYEIDTKDAAVFALVGLAAAATVGIADVTLFDYAFSDVIYTIGRDHGVTIATLISAGTFAWVFYTNESDLEKMDDEYTYAVIGTAALIVAIPFIPQVHDFVTSSDVWALGVLAVQSAGAVAVSYLGSP